MPISAAISASSGSRPSRRRSVADRAVHVAAQAAQRARRPVEVAQRVEHRALHAAARERVERHAERRLVAAGGVDQAEHADADEVGDLDLRRQALRQPLRQRLDERRRAPSRAGRASRSALSAGADGCHRALRRLPWLRALGPLSTGMVRPASVASRSACRAPRPRPASRDGQDPEAAARRRLRQVLDDRALHRAPRRAPPGPRRRIRSSAGGGRGTGSPRRRAAGTPGSLPRRRARVDDDADLGRRATPCDSTFAVA